MIVLVCFLSFFGACSCIGLYVSLWVYPLSVSTFWYNAMDSSNNYTSLLDEMLVILAFVNVEWNVFC